MPDKRATETVPTAAAPATNGSAPTNGMTIGVNGELNGHAAPVETSAAPVPEVVAVPVIPVVPAAAPAPQPAPVAAPARRSRAQTPDDAYENEVKRAKRYIEDRWDSQKKYYSKKAGQNKKRYQLLQLCVALGGATVPVLISLPQVPKEIPILISLAVALAAATENVYGYGDDWRSFRQVVEGLKRERALFEAAAGPYRKAKEPFIRFVERCEDIIAEETGRYFEREDRSSEEAAAANTAAAPGVVTPRVTGASVIQYDADHADDEEAALDPNASGGAG